MAAKTDYLVATAVILDRMQTIKAATWQDAVNAYIAAGQVVAGHVVCIPATSVVRARVDSFPNLTVTPV